jgi:hypothetical protein
MYFISLNNTSNLYGDHIVYQTDNTIFYKYLYIETILRVYDNPHIILIMSRSLDYQIIKLNDEEYAEAETYFLNAWIKQNTSGLRVERIFAIRPPSHIVQAHKTYERQMIDLLGEPNLNKRKLFHGTDFICDLPLILSTKDTTSTCEISECAGCGIIRDTFRLAQAGKNRRQTKWQRLGHGIYFSPWSSKCHYYSYPGQRPWLDTQRHMRIMFMADVILGKCYLPTQMEQDRRSLPQGYHSSHGRAGYCGLNYDEFVLFQEAACLPRYLYIYSFASTSE